MLGGVWHGREIIYAGAASGGLMRGICQRRRAAAIDDAARARRRDPHAWPAMVPGTSALLFTVAIGLPDAPPGILAALSLDAAGPAEAREWRAISEGVDLARALDGRDRLLRGAELHALRFDAARLAAAGAPRTVLSP